MFYKKGFYVPLQMSQSTIPLSLYLSCIMYYLLQRHDYRLCKQYKQEIKNNTCFLRQSGNLKKNSTTYNSRNFERWEVDTCRTEYGVQMLKKPTAEIVKYIA